MQEEEKCLDELLARREDNWPEKAKILGLESGYDKDELTHLVMSRAILELEGIIKTDRGETFQRVKKWLEAWHCL